MKKAFLVAISSIFLVACSDINSCNSDANQPFMVVSFFDSQTNVAKKVGFRVFSSDNADTLRVSTDSLSINLELNPLDTMVTFLFDSDTTDYTLQVRYDKEFSIFDPDCDPSLTFVNLDTLGSSFDSTSVIGSITNRQLSANLEVYF